MAGIGRLALVALGILAYQNRDKIGELLRGREGAASAPDDTRTPDDGRQPAKGGLLERALEGIGAGTGLGDLLDRFRQSGSAKEADTWVETGANAPIGPEQVKAAIDPETLDELSAQTGLSHDELLRRLASDIPQAVDKLTPDGRLPETERPTPAKGLLDDVPGV
jgi:uncharacterized protein YidB (DUF937 family)